MSADAINFDPVSDYLLVEEIKPGSTAGGIALPDSVKDDVPRGVVLRAGPGRVTELGALLEMPVEVGDEVFLCFALSGPPPQVKFGSRTCIVVRGRDVIAKVEKPERIGPAAISAVLGGMRRTFGSLPALQPEATKQAA